jgi:hypothetical protein
MIEVYNKGLPEKARLEPARGGTARFALTAGQAEDAERRETSPFAGGAFADSGGASS